MNKFCINLLRVFIAAIASSIAWLHVAAQDSANQYPYRLQDRYGDPYSWKSYNRFDIDTSLIKRTIIYDSVTKSYYIIEKFDSIRYRYPAAFTRSDFLNVQGLNDETDYYNDLSRSLSMLNYKQPRPKPRVFSSLFNRIFGLTPDGKKMDITSSGNIDLQLGYQGQNVQNPTLSEQARKTGSFNMNASADLSVIAQIGNKLRLPISYNTNGFFQFNNQLKLNYQGTDDEILKSVQAGNVSFQTKGSLMASMQNLFGIEAQLHFGNLIVTGVIANDRSQKQSVTAQGGGLSQNINISMGDYDENRNFLLGNYFVRHYNETMTTLPRANTLIKILRTEVWITNKSGADTSVRTVVGLMDLGENNPYNTNIHSLNSFNGLPSNSANDLYAALQSNPAARNSSTVATLLNARGLIQTADYEQTYARKLDTTEYVLNPQAGFIALSQQLQPDQVLAVAYQYSYNGQIFQVGEFSSDVALDSSQGTQKVLFLKLLKSSQQRTDLPLWNLEMKNVYSLNVFGMDSSSFNLNVYYQQPSGGTNPYLPQTAQSVSGKSIIAILGADKLNYRNDPGADGQFDYVPKFTVIPSQGKIIFPVLQPFGEDLDSLAYNGISQDIKNKYVYYQLYDSLKVIANTFANVNKFILQGVIKGSSNSVINIGAANVPPGSVIVTAGGRTLIEGVDYTVNYSLGQVQIINQTILDGNTPVNVQFENNANLGTAQRNFMGLRFDYTVNKKLSIGATYEKLSEQPYTFRTNYGEDPINNSMYGMDFNYHSDWPQLTKWLNKLPFYSSSAPSNITAYGEAAVLKPGHPKQIGSGENGKVYIDDFESSSNAYDLRTPFTSWSLASTPAGNGLFPEATLNNNLDYGKNRAQLSWYTIEPILQDKSNTSNPLFKNLSELSDPRVRPIYASELFPNQSTLSATLQTTTFDLSYYPTERGPYNFTDDPTNMDAQGHLLNPQKRWGGIMRSMDQTDFTSDNVEYIEVWMQDPFIKTPNSIGGKLMIDLGNVSEDVLKDGKRMYENGLSKSGNAEDSTSSIWGTVPTNPIQLVNAFSNDVDERNYQDVGFDGLNDDGERRKRLDYLNDLKNSFGENSPIYQAAYNDPSNDNYKWYRDPNFTSNDGILARYKHYNGTQGNSPVATNSSSASTTYPDNEDINADNTMNQNEQYYEYEVDLKPNMVLTDKYVSDVRDVQPRLANDSITHEHWYLLRIPITDFTNKIGNIAGFNSIRFMRMYLTGFQDSATVRFAELSLIRNTWRPFTFKLDTSDNYTNLPNDNTSLTITQVNTQDNSLRTPIPYKMPPGVQQLQTLQGTGSVSNGSTYIEKEQSMSLNITNLKQNDSRAVIKSMNMDMRQYGEMSMFIHAESVPGQTPVNNNDLVAVIRLGQDYINNYYEIRIPLKITLPNASASPEEIWPDSNRLLVALQDLVNLKMNRNASRIALNKIYSEQIGNETYAVKGNPNLAAVTSYLIGIENAANSQPVSTTVWTDELSLSKINEKGGWAAQGRVDVQLADLGSVSLSANTYSAGFGTIEQNVSEREMNSMVQYDASLNIDAGKLFPQKFGFSIPFFASLNKTILTPKYDPYSQDIIFKDELKNYSASQKDSAKNLADDITTTKTISFTNVRFGKPSMHPKIWSISNFDFSYTFTSINQTNPLVSQNTINQYNGNFGYTFSGQPRFWQPFKRLFHNKSPWLSFIRDININPTPSLLSFRYTINRQSSVYTPRVINPYDVNTDIDTAQTMYDNYFNLTRNYNLNWNLTKSLNIDFTATNLSVVDVPNRRLNKTDKDSIWRSFWRGGRNTQYSQTATMSYTLPFNKFPMFDWINAQYSYSANYNWIAANLQSVSLGNVIENGNTSNFNGQFNFRNLYNKSKLLKSVLNPSNNFNESPPQNKNNILQNVSEQRAKHIIDSLLKSIPKKSEVVKRLKGRERKLALLKWQKLKRAVKLAIKEQNAKLPQETNGAAVAGIRLLTLVKSITVNYSLTNNSRLPGYMDSTQLLGENLSSRQPGFGYIFGKMPTEQWLDQKARQHIISEDPQFNDYYSRTYTEGLNLSAELEPVKDLIIDLTATKSFNKNYSELFKDTAGTGNFQHLSPYSAGGFTVSYASFKSLFSKSSSGKVSAEFQNFSDFRTIISKRLAAQNSYYNGTTSDDGYATGYGRYAQNVLIPAFLAAYTGKSPDKVGLVKEDNPDIKTNPLGSIFPKPNWTINYSGLNRLGNLSDIFSSITITNAYNGSLAMNSFTSALNFQDPLMRGEPAFIDSTSGNYVPYFLIPNITISENFEPLIGLNLTLVNQSNIQFQYSKSKSLSLSLVDYQVSESDQTSYQLGFNIVKHNVNLPFAPKPKLKKGQPKGVGNDLSFGLNMSMTNQFTSNTTLDQTSNYSTGGQKVWMFSPSVNYVLNNRINLRLFFTQQRTVPYISTAPPITVTNAGLEIKISLQ